eukprot:TRINITY_DN1173_c2_g1_i1.p1 TRINITY_DN1173_c2_g1~~TRINITY_DN1173_c2_g1_i1.p1  ORF type:complete len:236 (+),score=36.57 TRINITY_DN1173_c2_g1_i1:339-1046(+)
MAQRTNKELIEFIRKNKKDYYTLFGVESTASEKEIITSYKKLALKLHPDRNKEEGAEECFKLIANVKNKLTDPTTRANYDTHGADESTDVDNGPSWEVFVGIVRVWVKTTLLSGYPYRSYLEEPLSPQLAVPLIPVIICLVFGLITIILTHPTSITVSQTKTSDLSTAVQLPDGSNVFVSPEEADIIQNLGISTSFISSQVDLAIAEQVKLNEAIDAKVQTQLSMRYPDKKNRKK